MLFPRNSLYVTLLLLGCPVAVVSAATVSFTDGDFDAPSWVSTTIIGAVSGQVSSRSPTDGNPGAFFSVTTTTNAITFTSHINPGFVYDPSAGAIDSVDINLDYRNIIAFGEGHGVGPVFAVQSGSTFVAPGFITGSTNFAWQPHEQLGILASDFVLRVGAGALDFSAAGAPITFGFETANSGGNTINVGYDNYALTLNLTAVPLPAAWLVFAPFAVLCARLRRPARD